MRSRTERGVRKLPTKTLLRGKEPNCDGEHQDGGLTNLNKFLLTMLSTVPLQDSRMTSWEKKPHEAKWKKRWKSEEG